MTGARSKIAEPAAKPSAGSRKADAATAPAPCTVRVINRRRVTVSPSKAPGMLRSAVYLDCDCWRGSGTGWRRLPPGVRRSAARTAPGALRGLVVRPRTRGHRRGAGLPHGVGAGGVALGVRLRTERDDVSEFGHRVEGAERGQPLQAEGVQPVARQQREVRLVRAHDATRAVVLEVSLADRLDDQRIALP